MWRSFAGSCGALSYPCCHVTLDCTIRNQDELFIQLLFLPGLVVRSLKQRKPRAALEFDVVVEFLPKAIL